MKRAIATGIATLGLAACSIVDPHPDWVQTPSKAAVAELLSGQSFTGQVIPEHELPSEDLNALPPVLVAAAEEIEAAHASPYNRAKALHLRLLGPIPAGGFGIDYDAIHPTLPPARAFAARKVNCLSYTLIYVAMARRMNLVAEVNDVILPPAWDLREGSNTMMLLRHVNAKVRLRDGDELIVDLEMQRYNPSYRQQTISGRRVEALYYSNRAMEILAEGDNLAAFRHMRRALELDPGRSYIWNNLGNLYFRNQRLLDAETAYLQGLSWNPRDLSLTSNLGALYGAIGEKDRATYFRRLAAEYREANPYFAYTRAQVALDQGELRQAEILALSAIEKLDTEPRFYALAAQVYEQLGDAVKARDMQRQADEIYRKQFL